MAPTIPYGPTGLGTAGLRITGTAPRWREEPEDGAPGREEGARGEGGGEQSGGDAEVRPGEQRVRPIPGIHFRPAIQPEPELVAEVDSRIKLWALELDLIPPEWEDQFEGFGFGRYVACHPDPADVDRLLVATRLMVAENAVDDCYCEDHGGSPEGLGERRLRSPTPRSTRCTRHRRVRGPTGTTAWPPTRPCRAYRSSWSTPPVGGARPGRPAPARHGPAAPGLPRRGGVGATRISARGLGVPGDAAVQQLPPLPDHHRHRRGYELPGPAAQPRGHTAAHRARRQRHHPRQRPVLVHQGNSPAPRHLNLPVVIAAREGVSERDAYLKAVEIHNEIMHGFETESRGHWRTAAPPPASRVTCVAGGLGVGNHEWHRDQHHRYSLPDFWYPTSGRTQHGLICEQHRPHPPRLVLRRLRVRPRAGDALPERHRPLLEREAGR